jgi:hypothetical protein
MKSRYAGRLFDKVILLVVKQTARVKENPDDDEYPQTRVRALRATAKALWCERDALQAWRREGCPAEPKKSEG